MNTIHSSSLAFYRTGYIKPGQDRFEKNQAKPLETDAESTKNQQTNARPISTPEQFKTALEHITASKDPSYDLPNNSRAAKALTAYTETRNQPLKIELNTDLSRIDFYV